MSWFNKRKKEELEREEKNLTEYFKSERKKFEIIGGFLIGGKNFNKDNVGYFFEILEEILPKDRHTIFVTEDVLILYNKSQEYWLERDTTNFRSFLTGLQATINCPIPLRISVCNKEEDLLFEHLWEIESMSKKDYNKIIEEGHLNIIEIAKIKSKFEKFREEAIEIIEKKKQETVEALEYLEKLENNKK